MRLTWEAQVYIKVVWEGGYEFPRLLVKEIDCICLPGMLGIYIKPLSFE